MADVSTPDQEAAWLLVRKCNPFERRDSLIAHMSLPSHFLRLGGGSF